MKLSIAFKHVKHSQTTHDKIKEMNSRLSKHFEGQIKSNWVCYMNNNEFCVDIDILGPRFAYHAKSRAENLYKSIEMAASKIERQLEKKKRSWKDHKHGKLDIVEPDDVYLDRNDDDDYRFVA